MNEHAKDYGVKDSASFSKRIDEATKDIVAKSLNKSTLVFKASESDKNVNGFSQHSLRALYLLNHAGSKDKDSETTVSAAVSKLLKQAVNQTTGGEQSKPKLFVVSSSAHYIPNVYSNEDINLLVARLGLKTLSKP